jgi:hypothetical protein
MILVFLVRIEARLLVEFQESPQNTTGMSEEVFNLGSVRGINPRTSFGWLCSVISNWICVVGTDVTARLRKLVAPF